MTTLSNRGKTALMVIDVQNGVVPDAYNLDAVLANINVAVAKAREAGIPVIWVQHSDSEMPIDSDAWQIVEQLSPQSTDSFVRKLYPGSFEGTDLESILQGLQISHLVITGMQTNNCVRHTTHSALDRGYDVTFVTDAHTTTSYSWNGHTVDAKNLVDEANDNLGGQVLPGRSSRGVSAAALTFA